MLPHPHKFDSIALIAVGNSPESRENYHDDSEISEAIMDLREDYDNALEAVMTGARSLKENCYANIVMTVGSFLMSATGPSVLSAMLDELKLIKGSQKS